jgi:hypothetical protein
VKCSNRKNGIKNVSGLAFKQKWQSQLPQCLLTLSPTRDLQPAVQSSNSERSVISELKRENQLLSKEVWESTRLISGDKAVNHFFN